MTFAIGHVEGGTDAGRKIQKPAPKPWTCPECVRQVRYEVVLPAYRVACDHGHKRPLTATDDAGH